MYIEASECHLEYICLITLQNFKKAYITFENSPRLLYFNRIL